MLAPFIIIVVAIAAGLALEWLHDETLVRRLRRRLLGPGASEDELDWRAQARSLFRSQTFVAVLLLIIALWLLSGAARLDPPHTALRLAAGHLDAAAAQAEAALTDAQDAAEVSSEVAARLTPEQLAVRPFEASRCIDGQPEGKIYAFDCTWNLLTEGSGLTLEVENSGTGDTEEVVLFAEELPVAIRRSGELMGGAVQLRLSHLDGDKLAEVQLRVDRWTVSPLSPSRRSRAPRDDVDRIWRKSRHVRLSGWAAGEGNHVLATLRAGQRLSSDTLYVGFGLSSLSMKIGPLSYRWPGSAADAGTVAYPIAVLPVTTR